MLNQHVYTPEIKPDLSQDVIPLYFPLHYTFDLLILCQEFLYVSSWEISIFWEMRDFFFWTIFV